MYSMVRNWTPRSSSASSTETILGWLEPGGDLDLAAEPEHRLAIAGERGGQDLERDDASRRPVPRLEDNPHASLAQLVEYAVVADDQAPGLPLSDGPRLVGGELAGPHQAPGQAGHAAGRTGRDLVEPPLFGIRTPAPGPLPELLDLRRSTGAAALDRPLPSSRSGLYATVRRRRRPSAGISGRALGEQRAARLLRIPGRCASSRSWGYSPVSGVVNRPLSPREASAEICDADDQNYFFQPPSAANSERISSSTSAGSSTVGRPPRGAVRGNGGGGDGRGGAGGLFGGPARRRSGRTAPARLRPAAPDRSASNWCDLPARASSASSSSKTWSSSVRAHCRSNSRSAVSSWPGSQP